MDQSHSGRAFANDVSRSGRLTARSGAPRKRSFRRWKAVLETKTSATHCQHAEDAEPSVYFGYPLAKAALRS